MPDLNSLAVLRDRVRAMEEELRKLRDKRDSHAVILAQAGVPEREVGVAAGLSGPYINQLKKRSLERAGMTR